MKKLFIGLIFILLGFNLKFGDSSIDILPNFIGYFMAYKGLEELKHENQQFANAYKMSPWLGFYALYIFLISLFGISYGNSLFYGLSLVVGIIAAVAAIYFTYLITKGVLVLEVDKGWNLYGKTLMSMWKISNILALLVVFVVWLPLLNLAVLILAILYSIKYLVAFNDTKKAYYSYLGIVL